MPSDEDLRAMQDHINDIYRRLDEIAGEVNGNKCDIDRIYMELGHDDPWA